MKGHVELSSVVPLPHNANCNSIAGILNTLPLMLFGSWAYTLVGKVKGSAQYLHKSKKPKQIRKNWRVICVRK